MMERTKQVAIAKREFRRRASLQSFKSMAFPANQDFNTRFQSGDGLIGSASEKQNENC